MDIPLGGWLFLFAASRSNWSSEHWFSQRKKKQEKKNLKARTRINNKLKLHVTPGLGIESGPQWWEASTLPAPYLFDITSKYNAANSAKKENWMAFYSLL